MNKTLTNTQELIIMDKILRMEPYTYDKLTKNIESNNFINPEQKLKQEFRNLIKNRNIYLQDIVSYATRPMRDGETDGVEHYFITPEIAKEKLEKESILAYTKIGEFEYFATVEALRGSNLYIIDPEGIRYLKEKNPNLNIKTIYISIPDSIREERCKTRSDYETSYLKRYNSENDQFTKFEQEEKWDLKIENIDLLPAVYKFVSYVIECMYYDRPLFLVTARTGSGKDTLIREAKRIINGEG